MNSFLAYLLTRIIGQIPPLEFQHLQLDSWKLTRYTRRCLIEGDNITERFAVFFAELQQVWLLPLDN